MAPALSRVEREELRKRRVKREQLRKRRNNLLRRHNEFWLLYGMKSWLIMESRDGQIFTYHSHPDTPPPSREDMVSRCWLEDGNLPLIGERKNAPSLLLFERLAIIAPWPLLSQSISQLIKASPFPALPFANTTDGKL